MVVLDDVGALVVGLVVLDGFAGDERPQLQAHDLHDLELTRVFLLLLVHETLHQSRANVVAAFLDLFF